MWKRAQSILAAAVIVVAGAIPSVLLYRHTAGYGFDYDDYHFVRPFTHAEVAAALHGPWDASGIELPYYRPFAIALFAARFGWFGFNSEAYHVASVAAFALAAALLGMVVWRLTSRWEAGALTAAAFAVHPAMPYALVAWVTNQMHLLELLLVLLALIWWNAVGHRAMAWWTPLWILAAAAFLTKEDGIMLLPILLALHWMRRRLSEPGLPPVPLTFTLGSALLVIALVWIRSEALAHTTSRSLPALSRALENYVTGLNHVFRLVPADRPWQLAASWFVSLLAIAGILAARRSSPGVRFGIAAGALLAAGFGLPFIFVTKNEQLHLVAAGAAIVLGCAAVSLLDAIRYRPARWATGALIGAGACALAAVSLDISRDFRPFGPIVLSHDRIVTTWDAVPREIHGYLLRKSAPGASSSLSPNPAVALDLIVTGVHPDETSPDGVRYRWMSGARTDLFVKPGARAITIPLRHEIGAFREPAEAVITIDGRVVDRIAFADGDWRVSRPALSPTTVPRLKGMHHVTIATAHAWVPSSLLPGSGDSRRLGLQIGVIDIR